MSILDRFDGQSLIDGFAGIADFIAVAAAWPLYWANKLTGGTFPLKPRLNVMVHSVQIVGEDEWVHSMSFNLPVRGFPRRFLGGPLDPELGHDYGPWADRMITTPDKTTVQFTGTNAEARNMFNDLVRHYGWNEGSFSQSNFGLSSSVS
jgi:hypothetical protein